MGSVSSPETMFIQPAASREEFLGRLNTIGQIASSNNRNLLLNDRLEVTEKWGLRWIVSIILSPICYLFCDLFADVRMDRVAQKLEEYLRVNQQYFANTDSLREGIRDISDRIITPLKERTRHYDMVLDRILLESNTRLVELEHVDIEAQRVQLQQQRGEFEAQQAAWQENQARGQEGLEVQAAQLGQQRGEFQAQQAAWQENQARGQEGLEQQRVQLQQQRGELEAEQAAWQENQARGQEGLEQQRVQLGQQRGEFKVQQAEWEEAKIEEQEKLEEQQTELKQLQEMLNAQWTHLEKRQGKFEVQQTEWQVEKTLEQEELKWKRKALEQQREEFCQQEDQFHKQLKEYQELLDQSSILPIPEKDADNSVDQGKENVDKKQELNEEGGKKDEFKQILAGGNQQQNRFDGVEWDLDESNITEIPEEGAEYSNEKKSNGNKELDKEVEKSFEEGDSMMARFDQALEAGAQLIQRRESVSSSSPPSVESKRLVLSNLDEENDVFSDGEINNKELIFEQQSKELDGLNEKLNDYWERAEKFSIRNQTLAKDLIADMRLLSKLNQELEQQRNQPKLAPEVSSEGIES